MDNYNQIIEAFKGGKVIGLSEVGQKPEYLQTEISHIFLFSQTVYKFYRRDSKGFNEYFFDLNDNEKRKKFYQEEFTSNHYFNPEVYQKLSGLKIEDNKVSLVDNLSTADDLVIQMKRIEATNNLTHILLNGNLNPDDYYQIGDQMTKALIGFNKGKEAKGNYYEIMRYFMDDLEVYLRMYEKEITREETDLIIAGLRNFVENHKDYFVRIKENSLIETIDNHADNTYYNNGRVSFIDAYLPKDSWRIVDPLYGVYRLLTDVAVLTSDETAMPIFKGFQNNYPDYLFDSELDVFYKIYFSCIRVGHFFTVAIDDTLNRDIALRYLNFIRSKLKIL